MNGHPQYAEALALYAMGSLDDAQELAALQAHLGTCGECRRELEALRADVALLALSASGPQPPARSRDRLLTAVAAEPRMQRRTPAPYAVGRLRPRWFSLAPVMVMVLLAVFSILLWRDLRNTRRTLRHTGAQLEQTQHDLDEKNMELAEAKMVRDLLHAPDAWPLTLVSKKTPPQPQGKKTLGKGVFRKCDGCNETHPAEAFIERFEVCPTCGYHHRLGVEGWRNLLLDDGALEEWDDHLRPTDPLGFSDGKKYQDRVASAQKATRATEAVQTGRGAVSGHYIARHRGYQWVAAHWVREGRVFVDEPIV